jgi:hypothetical protein
MTDAWDELLGPDAPRFRAALDQTFENSEFGRVTRKMKEQQEDQDFAKDEDRLRHIYGKAAYDRDRTALLRFAVENNLTDLDLAFRAFRGSSDPSAAQAEPTASTDPNVERFLEIKALLADDKIKGDERQRLKWEQQDLMDEHQAVITKALKDADKGRESDLHTAAEHEEGRATLRREANDASRRSNAERTARISRGYQDKSDRKSKEQKEKEQLLAADDLISGRVSIAEVARQHGETIGEPEISTPNAEALIQEIT